MDLYFLFFNILSISPLPSPSKDVPEIRHAIAQAVQPQGSHAVHKKGKYS